MKKVLVIFGGASSEHDVSCVSAKFVIENIPADKYQVMMLGITKNGEWFKYTGDTENLPVDKWTEDTENHKSSSFSRFIMSRTYCFRKRWNNYRKN